MKGILLNTVSPGAMAGETKLYGNPDVPETFEWPSIVDEDDIYDLSFMGQINLTALAASFPDAPLPKEGMLYFFYDLDAMAFSPFDETAARVILYGGTEPLEELALEDEEGNSLCSPVMGAEFSAEGEPGGDETGHDGPRHQLFGLPRGYRSEAYPRPIGGWVMLFQIDSTDEVTFEDGGTLCFFISPEKLAAADFSDVRVMIVPRG